VRYSRVLLAALIWLALCTSNHAFELRQSACESELDCAANSVVSLLPDWPANFTRNEEPEGSGIVLGDGTIIATADHVLGPANSARIRTRNGKVQKAEIILREPITDIALLKIPTPLSAYKKSKQANVAEHACAIGNSFGLDISITCGVVSAINISGIGFNPIEDFIQTDAAVNPGMSGGALVDTNGNLIGMLSAIFTKGSDANLGVNFAVSSQLLFAIMQDYENDQKISLRQPGIQTRPGNLQDSHGHIGIEVMRVITGSFEQTAGLQIGDIILKAGNRRIKNSNAYATAIALAGEGKELDLVVLRGKDQLQISLNLHNPR